MDPAVSCGWSEWRGRSDHTWSCSCSGFRGRVGPGWPCTWPAGWMGRGGVVLIRTVCFFGWSFLTDLDSNSTNILYDNNCDCDYNWYNLAIVIVLSTCLRTCLVAIFLNYPDLAGIIRKNVLPRFGWNLALLGQSGYALRPCLKHGFQVGSNKTGTSMWVKRLSC